MTEDELRHRLQVAAAIARDAASLAFRMRAGGMAETTFKGAQDFLTEADGATESFIRARLALDFPAEAIIGEEQGGAVAGEGPVWILDPIDGTSNFSRGGDRWCVSIGMAQGGRAVLGAIARHAPAELFTGATGCGAWLNGQPIRAAATADMRRAIIEAGWSLRRPVAAFHRLAEQVMGAGAGLRVGGSGTLGLVECAVGRLDGYLESHINAWDACAALAIAREAGCWTSDFDSGDWIAAGNPIGFGAPALGESLAAILAG
ncbi:inositol monophosphatase family protein [Falsiroseomonas selenitidurans]|uniref:Inositol monophosphatase n=1 Tax=Falsiroseomonas selenitidurans TaxID=2716335 RepID=A0ABX1EDM5_9PROT|nr:inositol monophosphatase [Falsiroseomonas selenitidurans]NKC33637.1 inositol monophosphatase [Falsiroseomonas selenitidurans]